MQTTQRDHLIMVLFTLALFLLEELFFLLLRHIGDVVLNGLLFLRPFIFAALSHITNVVDVLGMLTQDTVMETRGIATEHDVGATAGHISSNRDGSAASRLRNDLSFALVVLGVEHIVRDTLHLQHSR